MQLKKLSDKELVALIKESYDGAFEELISRYQVKAFSLASRLTRNVEDAEEVLQDVFVSVYRKLDIFEGKSSFSSWLYRVTVNSALMKLRKNRQEQSVPIEDEQQQVHNRPCKLATYLTEGESKSARTEIQVALDKAISSLPDEYRPVFVLRDIDGLNSKEVGSILNLSVPAVKSRLHRARFMLRKSLAPLYRELSGKEYEGEGSECHSGSVL